MSDPWNAFEHAASDNVEQSLALPSVCGDQVIFLGGKTLKCLKTHKNGELQHEALINDDSGNRTLYVTWR